MTVRMLALLALVVVSLGCTTVATQPSERFVVVRTSPADEEAKARAPMSPRGSAGAVSQP